MRYEPTVEVETSFRLLLPEPEFERTFRAYCNYLEDLAGLIANRHGFAPTLAEGVYRAVELQPAVRRVKRHPLEPRRMDALEASLRRCWGNLRRLQGELEDGSFDEESNAWLPDMGYFSIFHALGALALASRQPLPGAHRPMLNLASKEVQRGLFPFPWSARCSGCPQTKTHRFAGMAEPQQVHVLSRPTPETAEDRLAMLLRTTRAKELERRFSEERLHGSSRRLSARTKEQRAERLAPTTIFDVCWRLRKKAHYDDADVFVLGAAGPTDARRFAVSLSIFCDATVAAIEGAIAAYAGPHALATAAENYLPKIRSDRDQAVRQRAESWSKRASPSAPAPAAR